MSEIEEMFKPKSEYEIINDEDVVKAREIRLWRDYFNRVIRKYLADNHMEIKDFGKEDIAKITAQYTLKQKEVFMQQVIKTLETNYWKPIKRVRENHKSVLFDLT